LGEPIDFTDWGLSDEKISIAPIIVIILFSAKLTIPKGALEFPPIQAQFNAILSIYTALKTATAPLMPNINEPTPVNSGAIFDRNPKPMASSAKG